MTPAERLARLERMMVLIATHGRRTRNRFNDQIQILFDAQMRNEARFEQLADAQKRLSESQIHTDQRLDALIDIVRQRRPGDSSTG